MLLRSNLKHQSRKSTSSSAAWRWIFAGFFVSLLVHLLLYVWLNHVKIVQAAKELMARSEPVKMTLVQTASPLQKPAEGVLPSQPREPQKTMDQTDVLKNLPDLSKIDVRPDVDVARFQVPIDNPVLKGAQDGDASEIQGVDDLNVTRDLGVIATAAPVVSGEKVMIDPGSLDVGEKDGNARGDGLVKQGFGGKADVGAMVGNLDALIGMPADVLVGKTTSLPSDTLFDYDQALLKESARPTLLKIATLLDLHPEMFCWLDGYTDLFGTPVRNLELSRQRAQSVKDYLVHSLKIPENRVVVRGFGSKSPLVAVGTIEQQAPNRRVEMKLRKELPSELGEGTERKEAPVQPPEEGGEKWTPPVVPKSVPSVPSVPALPAKAEPAVEPVPVKRAEPAVVVKPAVVAPVPPRAEPERPAEAEPVRQPVRAVPIEEEEEP